MAKTFQDLLNEGQAKVLGIVSIVPMDDWNADTQYQKLNLVRHNGAAYLAKGGSKNVEPGVTQDWQSSWMLVYLDGILSPDGTYPNLTAGRVMHALAWGNKNYDGSSAQTITAADLGLADVYKPQGSIAYSALPATPSASNYGYVWNITNDFTTDSRFIEGAGKEYSAGTNVGVIEQNGAYYYDIFGAFVDLSNYATVEALNAEITRAKAAEQANAIAASKAQSTANSKYTKPSSGIPKSDLAQSVQDSLDKADQAATDIANIKNGTTVVGRAKNVIAQINGHDIADIFESDGVTVKEATQAQRASADEDGNNIPNTYAKQNGTYRNFIAGGVQAELLANNSSLNNCIPDEIGMWKMWYVSTDGNAQTITDKPTEVTTAFKVEAIKIHEVTGGARVIQRLNDMRSNEFARYGTENGSGGTNFQAWKEIVTSDGSYPTLGAGYLAKWGQVTSQASNTVGWHKFASVPLATLTAITGASFYSCIVLINGINPFAGSTSLSFSGEIEIDIRIDNAQFSTTPAQIKAISGYINVNNICYVKNTNSIDLYIKLSAVYDRYAFTVEDERYYDGGIVNAIEFVDTYHGTTAPSGAVYAVNRNVAAKGITPATDSDSDDVATTEWVNDKIDDIDVPAVPNLNGSTSYSGTYYAAKSLPGNGTFLVGTGTTSSPISGVNLNSRSGFTEADYISFGSATSGNGTLGSYTSHAYLGICWTKTNSSGEQYVTAYWIPTILLVNGDADHYFCVTDSEDFVNFWFSSNTRFNYVSSKISSMRVSLYDYNT